MRITYALSALVLCSLVFDVPQSVGQRGGRGGSSFDSGSRSGARSGGGSQRGGTNSRRGSSGGFGGSGGSGSRRSGGSSFGGSGGSGSQRNGGGGFGGFGGGNSQRGSSGGFGGFGGNNSQRNGGSSFGGFGGGNSQRDGSGRVGGYSGNGSQRNGGSSFGAFGGENSQRGSSGGFGGFGGSGQQRAANDGFGSRDWRNADSRQTSGDRRVGIGGGLSTDNLTFNNQADNSGMGPYGRRNSTPVGSRYSEGTLEESGVRDRPPTDGTGTANNGMGVRPGTGRAGIGPQGISIQDRPRAGAGDIGAAANRIERPPGTAPDLAAAPAADGYRQRVGTYYAPSRSLAEQGDAIRRNTSKSTSYTVDMFQGHPNAWIPQNIVTSSLYTHPGYSSLATGLGLNGQPIPHDFGGNIVIQPDAVYVDGNVVGTPNEYAQQASQLAAQGRTSEVAAFTRWLPLGVFAVVEGDQSTADHIFELAVNQQGAIRGNYHNLRSDAVESISGAVDKTTQRAAWTIGNDKAPVYEAGIANLTKEQTPLLVHVRAGQTHQAALIRLQQPQIGETSPR